MNHKRFHTLIDAWREETLTQAEASELSRILRQDEDARRIFKDEAHMHGLLHRTVAAAAVEWTAVNLPGSAEVRGGRNPSRRFGGGLFRPIVAAAAGLVFGAFCTSVLWAVADSKMGGSKKLQIALADTARDGRIPSGFPRTAGALGGDYATLESTGAGRTKTHGNLLRFMEAGADENDPNPAPTSCDVSQLVDLSQYRSLTHTGKATLELSASFSDASAGLSPNQRFYCWILVFQGKPSEIDPWPGAIKSAIASSLQHLPPSRLKGPSQWSRHRVQCTVPENADYAVIQIGVVNLDKAAKGPAQFGAQYADDIQLVLKTQE
jgi:hypothetical protein